MEELLNSRSLAGSLPGAFVALAVAVAVACAPREPTTPADLIVVNGAVYPGNGGAMAEAVAVAGDKVLRVGTSAEIQALKTARTQVLDARQGTVMAGFNDSHVHFLSGGCRSTA